MLSPTTYYHRPRRVHVLPKDVTNTHTFFNLWLLTASEITKTFSLAWLDLRNAFGSVPHEIISISLAHMGIPKSLIDLISNVYTGASTEIRTPNGTTTPIPVLAGIKQGCPLSPIIFNLCIEIIIRSINARGQSCGPALHHGAPISVLAYADDLVLISRNKGSLQQLFDAASSSASLIGLEFRQDKCASISLTNSRRVEGNLALNEFKVQGKSIHALQHHEHYRYLGIPIGVIRDVSNLERIVDDLCDDLDRINSSLLAPWQIATLF